MPPSWRSPEAALDWLAHQYRRDRTEGQPCQIVLGVEKATQVAFLEDWF